MSDRYDVEVAACVARAERAARRAQRAEDRANERRLVAEAVAKAAADRAEKRSETQKLREVVLRRLDEVNHVAGEMSRAASGGSRWSGKGSVVIVPQQKGRSL